MAKVLIELDDDILDAICTNGCVVSSYSGDVARAIMDGKVVKSVSCTKGCTKPCTRSCPVFKNGEV